MSNRLLQFGPLPIRVMLGATFLAHRAPSLADFPQFMGFMGRLGLPTEFAFVIAALEIGGAIAIMAGVLTRIASILLIALMTCTTFIIKFERGFLGGFEVDLLLLSIAASLLISGPGRVSIEWDVLKREIFPRGKKLVPQKAAHVP
ncbi:MAG TPA: DoxX family protein [Nitrososphaera sp.]